MISKTHFIKRYVTKLYNIFLYKVVYRKNFIPPNFYVFNVDTPYLARVKKILFFFNDPEIMHLGDHLFFMPLILALKDAGYDVTVAPTKPMQGFFKALDVNIVTGNIDFKHYDLLISRICFLQRLKNEKVVLVNTAMNLRMPVCDQLLVDFQKILSIPNALIFPWPTFDNLAEDTLGVENIGKAIMFSPYLNSTIYMKTKEKVNALINYAKKCSDEGYVVLLVGSNQDKLNDRNHYPFPVQDLRGKITIPQLVAIAKLPNVEYFVGFDAFGMHVFTLLQKSSHIVFRGRLSKKQHEMIKKYTVNLFQDKQYVTFL